MGEYKTYKELDAWKKSRAFVKEVYYITKDFPKDEQYGLMSQMRRCAVSIPSNIAEGYGRQFRKETLQFLYISRGSLYELETQIYIAFDLSYLNEEKLEKLLADLEECRRLLSGLINYFEKNITLK
ncbi:MAG: four helix bundle protein [Sphingobacteriales bacterium]|nr:four helix bundle protein [Sphingobacteriales bacterium]